MSTQRRLARFNRLVGNRLVGRILPAMPGFGALYHVGRKSGRQYRTPVKVFRNGDTYVMSLPYGPKSDWVRNTIAAGGCELVTRGRRVLLTHPRLFVDDGLTNVPVFLRGPLRMFRLYDFIELRPAEVPALEAPPARSSASS